MNALNENLINAIIKELRGEFGIPPYCSDESLRNYIQEGNHEFVTKYVLIINYEIDFTARSLLKNYVNYAYYHVTNDFFENYKVSLASWQMSKIGVINEKNTSV